LEEDLRLVAACLSSEVTAFDQLYHRFAPKMMVVCSRYSKDNDDAKDLLQDGFIRVFQQLNSFRGEGSLEGWIRKVIVSVALANYHKNNKLNNVSYPISDHLKEENHPSFPEDITSNIAFNDILVLIQELPPAYKIVFNLYVFEGYKHYEIAEQLSIHEGTSKSNLFQAKRILQKRITEVMFNIK
jgi:RNA polymerase sigma-70 factor (ECF subfamily)